MKRTSLIYQGVLLLLSVALSCRTNEPVPDPGFGPDGQARILSLTAPGIQATDVVIDQTNHQINITLPTSFSADYLPVRLKLTPDTRIVGYINAATGNGAVADSIELYVLKVPELLRVNIGRISSPVSTSNTYQVSLRQSGPLSFQNLTEPLSFTVNPTTVCVTLPVYNYMDDELTCTLMLTNRQSGQQLRFPQEADFGSDCYRRTRFKDGAVGVRAYFSAQLFYESGDYTVELTKPNGRRAVLSQPLRIVRGALEAYFDSYHPLLLGQPTEVLVANLRPTDRPSLIFRSRGQAPVIIQPIGFSTIQPIMQLGPLTGLQPGYYYVQLLVDGQPTTNFNRVVVQQGNELVIKSLYKVSSSDIQQPVFSPTESFDTPVTMIRGQTYVPTTNAYAFYPNGTDASQPRFGVFTSLSNPDQSYSIALVSDHFTLLNTVPPGHYQFLFRLIRPDGSQVDSIPFERDVIVQ